MLAQGIVISSLLLAGSAFADQVQARYVTTELNVTEARAASANYPVFTTVINATNVLNVTEVATATAYAEAVTSTLAAANTTTACFCPIAVAANVTETQVLSVNGSTPTAIAVAAEATTITVVAEATSQAVAANATWQPSAANTTWPAVAASATLCACQPVTTAQAVNQTAQPVGVPTTQSVGAETQGLGKNQVLNANSGVMEMISIQVAGVFTFIGLVGASVTFL